MKRLLQIVFRPKEKKIRIPHLITALIFVLMIGLCLCLQMFVQYGATFAPYRIFAGQPLLLLLNLAPIALLLGAVFFLWRNIFYAGAVVCGFLPGFAYANLLKIENREDALVFSDFRLVKEAFSALGRYELDWHPHRVAVIAAVVVVLAIVGHIFRKRHIRRPVRAAGVLACVLLFALLMPTYLDKALYDSFPVSSRYNLAAAYNDHGFNYAFLHSYRIQPVTEPGGYERAEAAAWDGQQTEPVSPEVKPNILIVMCEAFSDITKEPPLLMTGDKDPLADFYRAADSPNAVSGHLVVSNYGAGTANTEFNVMTGMQANLIRAGESSAFRVVRRPVRSLASALQGVGYDTFFLHPGDSWFYNRNSAYKYLGISDQVFVEDFGEEDYKGAMISDEAFLKHLKKHLESRMLENDAPLFTYSVTIQNHQSYWWGKFGEGGFWDVVAEHALSADAVRNLCVYSYGVADGARMLRELCEWVDTLDEPTIVAFFGDHRPNLGDTPAELGLPYNTGESPEAILETYKVPFLIRANYKADFASLDLPEGATISDNYLGSVLLELAGFSGLDPYFDMLSDMRRALPVYRTQDALYMLPDGSLTDDPGAEALKRIDVMHKWMYYRLTK